MAHLIPLSEQETAALIRAAKYRMLPLALGGSLIADRAPWAIALVELWRGDTVTDGGGI